MKRVLLVFLLLAASRFTKSSFIRDSMPATLMSVKHYVCQA